MAKPISEFRRPAGRGAVLTLWVMAALSAVNAVRQYAVGSGAVSRELAALWGVMALAAVVAAWGAWRKTRWALAATAVWGVVVVAVTVLGTALLYHGRPPVLAVLPGTMLAAVLAWLVVRGVRKAAV